MKLYYDWILSGLNEAARRILEAEMQARNYEYQSDFARKFVAEGRAEGRMEGRAEALLEVLSARGIAVTEEIREWILGQSDLATLDRLLARAVTATSASDLLSES